MYKVASSLNHPDMHRKNHVADDSKPAEISSGFSPSEFDLAAARCFNCGPGSDHGDAADRGAPRSKLGIATAALIGAAAIGSVAALV
jgi:hypothetical protein